jgi:HEAT repeat protein
MPLVRKSTEPVTIAALDPASIVNKLASASDDERWVAARGAANIPGSAKALGYALLKERDARVREAIFTSLARIASAESVGFLLNALRSDDATLRTGTLDALRSMKGQVAPYILHLLQDGDADVRLLACELVRDLPGNDAEVLLCDLLDAESQPNVCSAAIEVLAEVGTARALPVLARCEERFRATPFLAFSIKVATDRIRSQSSSA